MVKVKRYTAAWCGPCKILAPVFTQLQSEFTNVVFETIDVDQDKQAAVDNMVTSIPTVIIEKDGQHIQRYTGVQPKTTYSGIIKSLI